MNEYRFEDLKIGKEEFFTVTVTEEMMKSFLDLSGDTNPLHNDDEFAQKQGYQNKVVYGLLTTSFISRLVGVMLPGKYCLLQGIDVKYTKPVYVGDILIVKGIVDELHQSVQRAVIKIEIINQDEKKVVKGKAEIGFLKDE
jgi:3-hydroxybutyryl-CoA dehydratase